MKEPEFKLHHPLADRFGNLLDQLADTYLEDRRQIADISVVAQKYMERRGVHETLLTIMQAMNGLFPAPVRDPRYAEYIAAYIALRLSHYSHDSAVGRLRDLIAAQLR